MKETKENQWLRNYVTDELAEGCSSDECIGDVDIGEQAILPSYAATLINAVHVLGQATHNKIQILCGNGRPSAECQYFLFILRQNIN